LLHRFTHPRSMRNCRPKRKQSWAILPAE
jgi:hypothetical protein